MGTGGYFRIWRVLWESRVWKSGDHKLIVLWLWIIGQAAWKDHDVPFGNTVIPLKRGQFVTGKYSGAKAVHLSPSTFRRKLNLLQSMTYVGLQVDRDKTIVTVNNYDDWQNPGMEDGPEVDSKWTPSGPQVDLTEEEKKKRKRVDLVLSEPSPRVSRKRGGGNPKPEEILTLVPNPTNPYVVRYVSAFCNHVASLHEPLTWDTVKAAFLRNDWQKVVFAMMVGVERGFRKLAKMIELVDEHQDDPAWQARYGKFKEVVSREVQNG